jgi:hypothetical protein
MNKSKGLSYMDLPSFIFVILFSEVSPAIKNVSYLWFQAMPIQVQEASRTPNRPDQAMSLVKLYMFSYYNSIAEFNLS